MLLRRFDYLHLTSKTRGSVDPANHGRGRCKNSNPPKNLMRLKNTPEEIIVHHFGGTDLDPYADTSNHTYEMVNAYHRSKWNYPASNGSFCGYHTVIEKSGKRVDGTPDLEEGMHCIGKNTRSLGVSMAGNFDRQRSYPTPEQLAELKEYLFEKTRRYNIKKIKIVPHRQYATRSCYGWNLGNSWARDLIVEVVTRDMSQIQAQIFQLQLLVADLVRQITDLLKRRQLQGTVSMYADGDQKG